MEKRIKTILKIKDLSAAQFADEIGIQRSSVSHVLSNRNKPSMDFIQKILQAYPDINAEWLLLGKGAVTKGSDLFSSETIEMTKEDTAEELPELKDEPAVKYTEKEEISDKSEEKAILSTDNSAKTAKKGSKRTIATTAGKDDDPVRIILLHADATFEILRRKDT